MAPHPPQTTSQTELENWITAIHSACAATVARHHHKEDTLRLLKSEIKKLEQKIDMDEKMKKMGEMQLSSVTDSKKKKTILDQVIVLLPCSDVGRILRSWKLFRGLGWSREHPWLPRCQPVIPAAKFFIVTVSPPPPHIVHS